MKHYNNLLMSLPEDHMITLERFYDIKMYEISNEAVNEIMSSVNSRWSNKKIFDLLISATKTDCRLLGFSFLVERLTTGGILLSDCPNIQTFRNG